MSEVPHYARLAHAAPAREICFRHFAVLHSGATRTPMRADEHLTVAKVQAAEAMKRTNRFHAESRLPRFESSEEAEEMLTRMWPGEIDSPTRFCVRIDGAG
ncbi:DNA/RNA non-specific endonuclease [Aureimonas sp. AU4]|uniref:DNA/RNA non-specific endonuclease n=1 Tax=Aureimonas sp. AU4 TaxID=1638163 RepID=UPI000784E3DC|nr:DNA/RNA non-specific endonuclease [Aureimonas sp. AU4]